MRDSPALPLISGLQARGATVRGYDPQAMEAAREMGVRIDYCDDAYSTAENCDALVICTEWNEFRSLNFDKLKSLLKKPVLIDLRNLYDPARMRAEGFHYSAVGRGADTRIPRRAATA
jgi:UDPglucose 6-dehydrogenase